MSMSNEGETLVGLEGAETENDHAMSKDEMRKREDSLAAKPKELAGVCIKGSFEREEIGTNQSRALCRLHLQEVSPVQSFGSTCRKLQFNNFDQTDKAAKC